MTTTFTREFLLDTSGEAKTNTSPGSVTSTSYAFYSLLGANSTSAFSTAITDADATGTSGSLLFTASGSQRTDSNAFQIVGSYEAYGVPAYSAITGISVTYAYSAGTITSGGSATAGIVEWFSGTNTNIANTGTQLIAAQTAKTTSDAGAWTTVTGSTVSFSRLASTSSFTLRLNNTLVTPTGGGATSNIYYDYIRVNITYEPALASTVSGTTSPSGEIIVDYRLASTVSGTSTPSGDVLRTNTDTRQFALRNASLSSAPVTFQASPTNTVTLASHGLSSGASVWFSEINTTTGIATNTRYYVKTVTTNTFQLSTGGNTIPPTLTSTVTLTNNGTGTIKYQSSDYTNYELPGNAIRMRPGDPSNTGWRFHRGVDGTITKIDGDDTNLILGTESGTLYLSTDRYNWNLIYNAPSTTGSVRPYYQNKIWTALEVNTDVLATSTNGLDWEEFDTGTNASFTSIQYFDNGNKIHRISIGSTGGGGGPSVLWASGDSYTLTIPAFGSFAGGTTASITYADHTPATAATTIKSRIEALSGGTVDVTLLSTATGWQGSGVDYEIEFKNVGPTSLVTVNPTGVQANTTTIVNRWVFVGNTGTIYTATSSGTTFTDFTARTSGTSANLQDITWNPALNEFIAVGQTGTILTSPNGVTWTSQASGTTELLYSVACSFGVGRVVATGTNGKIVHASIYTTTSWLSATPPTTGTGKTIYSVYATGTRFVTSLNVVPNGWIWTSTDGINWSEITLNTYTATFSIYYDSVYNLWLAGGRGPILTAQDPTVSSITTGNKTTALRFANQISIIIDNTAASTGAIVVPGQGHKLPESTFANSSASAYNDTFVFKMNPSVATVDSATIFALALGNKLPESITATASSAGIASALFMTLTLSVIATASASVYAPVMSSSLTFAVATTSSANAYSVVHTFIIRGPPANSTAEAVAPQYNILLNSFGVPIADVSTGSWTPTPLYSRLDDANDTDDLETAISTTDVNGDAFTVLLSAPDADMMSRAGFRVVYKAYAVNTQNATVTVTLLEGLTIIATWTDSITAFPNAIVMKEHFLSQEEMNSITALSNLRLRIEATV